MDSTFDYQRFIGEVDALKRGAYRQLQQFTVPVGAVPASGQPGSGPGTPVTAPLPGPCNSVMVVPQGGNDQGIVAQSSLLAVLMLRINGIGPWIPLTAAVGKGFQSFAGTIWKLEYYVLTPDAATPQLVVLVGLNVSGSLSGGASVGAYNAGSVPGV